MHVHVQISIISLLIPRSAPYIVIYSVTIGRVNKPLTHLNIAICSLAFHFSPYTVIRGETGWGNFSGDIFKCSVMKLW